MTGRYARNRALSKLNTSQRKAKIRARSRRKMQKAGRRTARNS